MTIGNLAIAIPAAAALALVLAAPASAQDHTGHAMTHRAGANDPAVTAYRQAMDKMHAAMSSMDYSGDADVDFARGMIPHHQAAIDMARTVLEHGKDPEIRKLAEAIVAAQESEIKELEAWLKAHARM